MEPEITEIDRDQMRRYFQRLKDRVIGVGLHSIRESTTPETVREEVRLFVRAGIEIAKDDLELSRKESPNQMHTKEEERLTRYQRALEEVDAKREGREVLIGVIEDLASETKQKAEEEYHANPFPGPRFRNDAEQYDAVARMQYLEPTGSERRDELVKMADWVVAHVRNESPRWAPIQRPPDGKLPMMML